MLHTALRLIVASLALAACAPHHGQPLFAVSRSGPSLTETTAVDREGVLTRTDRAGVESSGTLTKPRFDRLRAVFAAAALGVVTQECATESSDSSSETLNVADHERGRYVTYVKPCLVPDPTTERALACLESALDGSDDWFAQKCGAEPSP